jgi:hypothetical protein
MRMTDCPKCLHPRADHYEDGNCSWGNEYEQCGCDSQPPPIFAEGGIVKAKRDFIAENSTATHADDARRAKAIKAEEAERIRRRDYVSQNYHYPRTTR